MLQLKNIKKIYRVGEIETRALDGISVTFRDKEFVAILGVSGSGKTTALNIIGGLDRYDSGELIIKGKRTSDFKAEDWDAYRNNSVGFVFQNYNLISHTGIVANVELGLTLSGVSAEEKHRRAIDVLRKVGLGDHLHKKPGQLSGGQMQRVAIARALANDPEILLCDEPTGALDTTTSAQIMDLIKELSRERLVIVVTHNSAIADKYADRIIQFGDGKIISDTNPSDQSSSTATFSLKKTKMSFASALALSFSNIRTKKWRTILTSLASSLGIIGIAVILSLSNGFQKQIDIFQSDTMSEFPLLINQAAAQMSDEDRRAMREEMKDVMLGTEKYADVDEVFLYNPSDHTFIHRNKLTDEFTEYLEKIDPNICRSIGYTRLVAMNTLRLSHGKAEPITLLKPAGQSPGASMGNAGLSSYPNQLGGGASFLERSYDLLAGEYPSSPTDLVLVIDTKNRIDRRILDGLGFETADIGTMKFTDIIGYEMKIIPNDVYYVKTDFGTFLPGSDHDAMFASDQAIPIKISGVVRQKEGVRLGLLSPGIAYSDELAQIVIESGINSEIIKAQLESERNVITTEEFSADAKKSFISYLGGSSVPFMIMVYPDTFEHKDAVLDYIEAYNEGRTLEDKIVASDLAGSMSELTGGIMDGVTTVLIAFAGISLVVSLIMICIITYTSVLERTKEIGILRALGARKKDITRVFDAETCILGIFSGVLGITIAYLLTFPINVLLLKITGLSGVAILRADHALGLAALSTILTILGGHIPAIMASNKDAVDALRSE